MAQTRQAGSRATTGPPDRYRQDTLPIEVAARPAPRRSRPRVQLTPRQQTVGEMVLAFHQAFDLPRQRLPSTDVDDLLAQLRVRLLEEESAELVDAVRRDDIVAIADALADIVYVTFGTAVTYGIDLEAVLREVHRSNMSKLDASGRPVMRDDGKVLKSERYTAPEIGVVLGMQDPLF